MAPNEDADVLIQEPLADPAEGPQEVPQPRPQPLRGVGMDLPHAIAVVVPRPLVRRVADRGVPAACLRQSAVPRPPSAYTVASSAVARPTNARSVAPRAL